MDNNHRLNVCNFELLDDPALKTTANNYEFKYTSGEQIQRIIKMVHKDRLKQKKDSVWKEFCNFRNPAIAMDGKSSGNISENPIIKTKSSTVRILTQSMNESRIELKSPEILNKSNYVMPKIRIMSDEEIKNVVDCAVKEVLEKTGKNNFLEENDNNEQPIPNKNPQTIPECSDSPKWKKVIETIEEVESFQMAICQDISEKVLNVETLEFDNTIIEEQNDCNVNVIFHKETHEGMVSPKSIKSSISNTSDIVDNQKDQAIPEKEDDEKNLDMSIDADHDLLNSPDQGLSSIEREELRKFLGMKEMIMSTEIKMNENERKSSSSILEENEKEELSKNICPIIHIRQPDPILESEDDESDIVVMKKTEEPIFKKPITPKIVKTAKSITPRKSTPRPIITPRQPKSVNPKSPRPGFKQEATKSALPVTPRKSPKIIPQAPVIRKPPSEVILSPTRLAELKQEKLLIFSRITSYQEKIIYIIEEIRASLADIPEPDGNIDRKRRERRATEFTTRFARNNLYQLSRLMDEIRGTPKDQYLSKNTNDFRLKICNLFGIIHQSIQSYFKNMSNFIVDRNPQKLDTLINLIIESTKLCIHKRIFDRRDALINKLLKKCSDILSFLQDLQNYKRPLLSELKKQSSINSALANQRKLSMYDSPFISIAAKRKPTSNRNSSRFKAPTKSLLSSCTDLTGRTDRGRKKSIRNIPQNLDNNKSSVYDIHASNNDRITTQIESMEIESQHNISVANEEYLNELNFLAEEDLPDSANKKDINNTVIEALQSMTERQVKQILAPLMDNIGAFVTDKSTVPAIHTMLLSGLNSNNPQSINNNNSMNDENYCNDETTAKQQQNDIPISSNNLRDNKSNNEQQLTQNKYEQNNFTSSKLISENREENLQPQRKIDENIFINNKTGSNDDVIKTSSRTKQNGNQDCSGSPRSRKNLSTVNLIGDGAAGDGYNPQQNNTTMKNINSVESNEQEMPRVIHDSISSMGKNSDWVDTGATVSTRTSTERIQQLRYDRNVQFTFVTSTDDEIEKDEIEKDEIILGNLEKIHESQEENSGRQNIQEIHQENSGRQQKIQPENPVNPNFMDQNLDKILNERIDFLQQITENPLYVNELFTQPWKVVTGISEQIVNEAISSVEKEINFGEESYVRDFLQSEFRF